MGQGRLADVVGTAQAQVFRVVRGARHRDDPVRQLRTPLVGLLKISSNDFRQDGILILGRAEAACPQQPAVPARHAAQRDLTDFSRTVEPCRKDFMSRRGAGDLARGTFQAVHFFGRQRAQIPEIEQALEKVLPDADRHHLDTLFTGSLKDFRLRHRHVDRLRSRRHRRLLRWIGYWLVKRCWNRQRRRRAAREASSVTTRALRSFGRPTE